jgi:hypothetical protein
MLVQILGIDVSPDQLEGRSELQPGQAPNLMHSLGKLFG